MIYALASDLMQYCLKLLCSLFLKTWADDCSTKKTRVKSFETLFILNLVLYRLDLFKWIDNAIFYDQLFSILSQLLLCYIVVSSIAQELEV